MTIATTTQATTSKDTIQITILGGLDDVVTSSRDVYLKRGG